MHIEAFPAIAERFARNLSWPEAAQQLALSLIQEAGAAACRVWVLEPGDRCHTCHLADQCRDRTRCLHLTGTAGCDLGIPNEERCPVDVGKIGQVARTRAPFVCRQAPADPSTAIPTSTAMARIKCCTGWPLMCDDNLVGVLVLYSREELSDCDLQQISRFSKRTGSTIANLLVVDELRRRVERLERHQQIMARELLSARYHEQILGGSSAAIALRERIASLAGRPDPVLISGPPGSGKELAARALHTHGLHPSQPFVRIDCRGVRPDQLECELFGHEADIGVCSPSSSVGTLELVGNGTLFLKHVDRLPEPLQRRILQASRSGRAARLRASSAYAFKARLIGSCAAIPVAPPPLLAHLSHLTLLIPSLPERAEDVPLLIEHNARRFARLYDKPEPWAHKADIDALQRYPWPGNVRELMQMVERTVLLSSGPAIRFDLPGAPADPAMGGPPDRMTLEDVERAHILRVLRSTRGVVQGARGAARLLGLRPSTLRSRMAKLGIPRHPQE